MTAVEEKLFASVFVHRVKVKLLKTAKAAFIATYEGLTFNGDDIPQYKSPTAIWPNTKLLFPISQKDFSFGVFSFSVFNSERKKKPYPLIGTASVPFSSLTRFHTFPRNKQELEDCSIEFPLMKKREKVGSLFLSVEFTGLQPLLASLGTEGGAQDRALDTTLLLFLTKSAKLKSYISPELTDRLAMLTMGTFSPPPTKVKSAASRKLRKNYKKSRKKLVGEPLTRTFSTPSEGASRRASNSPLRESVSSSPSSRVQRPRTSRSKSLRKKLSVSRSVSSSVSADVDEDGPERSAEITARVLPAPAFPTTVSRMSRASSLSPSAVLASQPQSSPALLQRGSLVSQKELFVLSKTDKKSILLQIWEQIASSHFSLRLLFVKTGVLDALNVFLSSDSSELTTPTIQHLKSFFGIETFENSMSGSGILDRLLRLASRSKHVELRVHAFQTLLYFDERRAKEMLNKSVIKKCIVRPLRGEASPEVKSCAVDLALFLIPHAHSLFMEEGVLDVCMNTLYEVSPEQYHEYDIKMKNLLHNIFSFFHQFHSTGSANFLEGGFVNSLIYFLRLPDQRMQGAVIRLLGGLAKKHSDSTIFAEKFIPSVVQAYDLAEGPLKDQLFEILVDLSPRYRTKLVSAGFLTAAVSSARKTSAHHLEALRAMRSKLGATAAEFIEHGFLKEVPNVFTGSKSSLIQIQSLLILAMIAEKRPQALITFHSPLQQRDEGDASSLVALSTSIEVLVTQGRSSIDRSSSPRHPKTLSSRDISWSATLGEEHSVSKNSLSIPPHSSSANDKEVPEVPSDREGVSAKEPVEEAEAAGQSVLHYDANLSRSRSSKAAYDTLMSLLQLKKPFGKPPSMVSLSVDSRDVYLWRPADVFSHLLQLLVRVKGRYRQEIQTRCLHVIQSLVVTMGGILSDYGLLETLLSIAFLPPYPLSFGLSSPRKSENKEALSQSTSLPPSTVVDEESDSLSSNSTNLSVSPVKTATSVDALSMSKGKAKDRESESHSNNSETGAPDTVSHIGPASSLPSLLSPSLLSADTLSSSTSSISTLTTSTVTAVKPRLYSLGGGSDGGAKSVQMYALSIASELPNWEILFEQQGLMNVFFALFLMKDVPARSYFLEKILEFKASNKVVILRAGLPHFIALLILKAQEDPEAIPPDSISNVVRFLSSIPGFHTKVFEQGLVDILLSSLSLSSFTPSHTSSILDCIQRLADMRPTQLFSRSNLKTLLSFISDPARHGTEDEEELVKKAFDVVSSLVLATASLTVTPKLFPSILELFSIDILTAPLLILLKSLAKSHAKAMMTSGGLLAIFAFIKAAEGKDTALLDIAVSILKSLPSFPSEMVSLKLISSFLELLNLDHMEEVRVRALLKLVLNMHVSIYKSLLEENILDRLLTLFEKASTEGLQITIFRVIKTVTKSSLSSSRSLFAECPSPLSVQPIESQLSEETVSTSDLSPSLQKNVNKWAAMDHNQQWKLLYRASRDKWLPRDLHIGIDRQSPTLIVATADSGTVFGAFTTHKWSRFTRGYIKDDKAFLFSHVRPKGAPPIKLPVKTTAASKAVYVDGKDYPCLKFGEGPDLLLLYASDKSIVECPGQTYAYSSGPIGHNFFTGDPKALLVELEIYGLKEAKPKRSLLRSIFTSFVNPKPKPTPKSLDKYASSCLRRWRPTSTDVNVRYEWELKYDTTVDGSDTSKFFGLIDPSNAECDSASSKVVVVTLRNGRRFGAFLGLPKETKKVSFENMFLFSLPLLPRGNRKRYEEDSPLHFPLRKGEEARAISFNPEDLSEGIYFGRGTDLYLNFSNPTSSFSNLGCSYALPSHIKFMSTEAGALLAGSPTRWKIEKIELFADKVVPKKAPLQVRYGILNALLAQIAGDHIAVNRQLFDFLLLLSAEAPTYLSSIRREARQLLQQYPAYELQRSLRLLEFRLSEPGFLILNTKLENSAIGSALDLMDSRAIAAQAPLDVNVTVSRAGVFVTHIIIAAKRSSKSKSERSPVGRVLVYATPPSAPSSTSTSLSLSTPSVSSPRSKGIPHKKKERISDYLQRFEDEMDSPVDINSFDLLEFQEEEDSSDTGEDAYLDKDQWERGGRKGRGGGAPSRGTARRGYWGGRASASSLSETDVFDYSQPIACITLDENGFAQHALSHPIPQQRLVLRCYPHKDVSNSFVSLNLVAFVGYDPLLNYMKPPPAPASLSNVGVRLGLFSGRNTVREFRYVNNFDFNGILYWLGTGKGSRSTFTNPYLNGDVEITLSHAPFNSTMMIANTIARTSNVTYFGGSTPQWFMLDLKKQSVLVSHITLRHGYNYPNSYMTNVKFYGSTDSKTWVEIFASKKSFFSSGFDVVTLPIANQTIFFRYFKIEQSGNYSMGKSSSGAPYLCLAGLELYGRLKSTGKALSPSSESSSSVPS